MHLPVAVYTVSVFIFGTIGAQGDRPKISASDVASLTSFASPRRGDGNKKHSIHRRHAIPQIGKLALLEVDAVAHPSQDAFQKSDAAPDAAAANSTNVETKDASSEINDSPEDKEVGMVQGVTLIAFVLFFFGIIQMLNYPDPQVHAYSFKTVFACIAIFEALSLVEIQSNVIMAELVDPYVGGKTSAIRHLLSSFVFLGWWWGNSIICWRVRRDPDHLFAGTGILSHVSAFVLIEAYADAQMEFAEGILERHGMHSVYGVYMCAPVITAIAFTILRFLAKRFRKWWAASSALQSRDVPGTANVASEEAKHPDGTHPARRRSTIMYTDMQSFEHWMKEMDEGENQCAAAVIGFLICRACYCVSAQRVPPVDCEKDAKFRCRELPGTWWVMVACLIGLYILVFSLTYFKAAFKKSEPSEEKSNEGSQHEPRQPVVVASHHDEFQPAILANLQLSLLMAMSWCILVIVRWTLNEGIPGGLAGHRIANAFVMSPICIAAIIVMDKLADREIISSESAEAFMRTFALCVGLEWEKAVQASQEAAIDVSAIGRAHPILLQLAFSVVLGVALLPAWMWFIVPVARLPVPARDH